MGPRTSIVTALVTALILGCAQSSAAQTAPIDGTVKNAAGDVIATFEGEFRLQGFKARGDELVAVGRVSGQVKNTAGQVIRNVKNAPVALPVDLEQSGFGAAGAGQVSCCQAQLLECDVLNLVLGPLDLNLLGLEVSLNQVVLDIVADTTGGLLGQILAILCGLNLAGLLDSLLGSLPLLSGFLNFLLLLFGL